MRFVKGFGLWILSLWILYAAAATTYLQSGLISRNFSEDHFSLRLDSAFSFIPGLVHFDHLQIEDADPKINMHWRLSADQGSVLVFLPSLILRRLWIPYAHILSTRFEFQEAPAKKLASPQTSSEREQKKELEWKFLFSKLKFDLIEEFVWNDLRIEKIPHLKVGLHLSEILEAKEGELPLSGFAQIDAPALDLRFLNPLLKKIGPLTIERGFGSIKANVHLKNAEFQKNSSLAVNFREIEFLLFGHRVSGDGKAEWQSQRGSEFEIELKHYRMNLPSHPESLFAGEGMSIEMQSPERKIDQIAKTFSGKLRIPKTSFENFAAINRYFPKDLKFRIHSGKAYLQAEIPFSWNQLTQEEAFLKMVFTQMKASFLNLDFAGNLSIRFIPQPENLASNLIPVRDLRFKISNSELSRYGRILENDWWADFSAAKASIRFSEPIQLKTDFRLEMKNSKPFMEVYRSSQKASPWIIKALGVNALKASGNLVLGEDLVDLRNFQFQTESSFIEGAFRSVHEKSKALFLLQKGLLGVSVFMNGGKTDFKLVNAKSWYQHRRWW